MKVLQQALFHGLDLSERLSLEVVAEDDNVCSWINSKIPITCQWQLITQHRENSSRTIAI